MTRHTTAPAAPTTDHGPPAAAPRDALGTLFTPDDLAGLHERMRAACEHPLFHWHPGLTAAQRGELAYRRLRHLDAAGPGAETLLAQPLQLFALQEWAALTDGAVLSLAAIHYNLCLGTILDHGGADREDLRPVVDELATMRTFGVFLATELGYGNNVVALETEATYDPDSGTFDLHTPTPRAVKYMPNTALPLPKTGVVLARLRSGGRSHGVFPFLVRIRGEAGRLLPGIRVWSLPEKPGLDLDNAITRFDHVRLPFESLLTGPHSVLERDGTFRSSTSSHGRFADAIHRVLPGKLGLAGGHLAAARAALTLAFHYSHQRLTSGRVGGVPLYAYRSHRSALLTELVRTYAASLLLDEVRRDFASSTTRSDLVLEQRVALTKAMATWSAAGTIDVCRERCGAQGLFAVNRIAEYLGTGMVAITSEGDNAVVASKAAQQLVMGIGGPAPGEAVDAAADRGDGVLGRCGSLLLAREQRLTQDCRAAVADNPGRSPFEAWNAVGDALIAIADAHSVRCAHEAVRRAAVRVGQREAAGALERVADLYALLAIDEHCGFYLTEGLVSLEEARALPGLLAEAQDALTPIAQELVEAFGIPRTVLNAPIGAPNYVAAHDPSFGISGIEPSK
ncbi:acyl-CoA dehydrogenase [Actinosynnema sp. NPDC053489]|uniref:acyl-CoA dehydrogenase family protein n=1 Tax=Actinosynnema sp. NPDC053489 TaxID=3363916 RepID=UPI0037CA1D57